MKMNKLIIAGLFMMPLVILLDRFVITIPDHLAIILYAISLVLLLAGMLKARKEKENHMQK
ncbi:MAG TPA: hypothetical protein DCG51_02105 [Erysipelotrichaceae bacterium]|nr:hypothetical protein [Erysipelotrichaceae bacterium]